MNVNEAALATQWLGLASNAVEWPEPIDLAVRSGQVWRAQWDNVVSLVFIDEIVNARKNFVRVAPVTIGQDDADDTAIIVSADRSSFPTELTIWPDLVRDIAEVVLDRLLVTFERELATVAKISHAAAHNELDRGLPVLNMRSPRLLSKKNLEIVMDVFASATELPSGDDSLEGILAPVVLDELVLALEVSKQTALKILRGTQAINRVQADQLSTLTGRTADELLSANPSAPTSLIEALTSLRRGPEFRSLARKYQQLESEVLSDVFVRSLALAARGEKQVDWDGRVSRYIASALASR